MPKEEQISARVDEQLNVLVTLDHLELILLGQEGVDVGLYVGVGLQDTVPYPLLNWKKTASYCQGSFEVRIIWWTLHPDQV